MPIRTPGGANLTLGDVASYRIEMTRSQIRRYKGQRAITVFANIDEEVTTSFEVNQLLQDKFKEIEARYPGLSLDFSGEFKEFQESFVGLVQGRCKTQPWERHQQWKVGRLQELKKAIKGAENEHVLCCLIHELGFT